MVVTNATKVCEGDGFSAVLNDDGTVIPVTVIEAYKLVVVGKKN